MRSVSVKGLAQYRYRWDNIDTTRDLNLTPVGNDEIEDEKFKAEISKEAGEVRTEVVKHTEETVSLVEKALEDAD